MHELDDPMVGGVERAHFARWLRQLSPTYRWGGRQGIDRIRPGLESRVLAGTYEQAMADQSARVLVERDESGPAAATILRRKPMETACFGIRTAALSHVVSPPATPDRLRAIGRLLTRAMAEAAGDDVSLVILRVDAEDVETLAAAQDAGFHVHESTTAWLADSSTGPALPPLPEGLTVEIHDGEVAGVLDDDEVCRLVEVTTSWQMSHFRADPRLSDEAVDRFYERWVHNIASGQWSDCVYIVRHRGRLIGLASDVSDRDLLDLTGTELRVMEWLVVTEPGHAAGRYLMAAASRHAFPGGRWHSWETQARNTAMIHRFEQTGNSIPVRSSYTLHVWPKDD